MPVLDEYLHLISLLQMRQIASFFLFGIFSKKIHIGDSVDSFSLISLILEIMFFILEFHLIIWLCEESIHRNVVFCFLSKNQMKMWSN